MLKEAINIEDKITLTDRIYQQERTIKYYEDRLNNMDKRVVYTTINLNINEKASDWANISVVGFSELVKGVVGSLNGLLYFLFLIVPWAVLIGIIRIIYKIAKR